jgi:hypothetical protein
MLDAGEARSTTPTLCRLAVALVCAGGAFLGSRAAAAQVKRCLDAAEEGQTSRDSGAYIRARDDFVACAGGECPGEVRKRCVDWLEEVEKLMPTVVFAAQAGGREVADVRVVIDGDAAVERLDGKPLPVDPGEHHFRFERAGEDAVEEAVVILAGEKGRRVSARFGPEPAVLLPTLPSPAPSSQPPSPSPSAYVYTAAFGLAGLAAGAILDLSGFAFLQQCNGDPSCSRGHEVAEVQWRFVTGDVLIGAGVASGVVAWLLWRHAHAQASGALLLPAASLGIGPSRSAARLAWTLAF